MGRPIAPVIDPAPTPDEAAAVVAALAAYLAEQRAARPRPAPPANRWAIAGRLENQNRMAAQARGHRAIWPHAARLR